MLRGLKTFGVAQAVGGLAEQGAPAFKAAVTTLSQLPKAEMAGRKVCAIDRVWRRLRWVVVPPAHIVQSRR